MNEVPSVLKQQAAGAIVQAAEQALQPELDPVQEPAQHFCACNHNLQTQPKLQYFCMLCLVGFSARPVSSSMSPGSCLKASRSMRRATAF